METMEVLKIGAGYITLVGETMKKNNISGKILYVSDPVVDNLYGDIVTLKSYISYSKPFIDSY